MKKGIISKFGFVCLAGCMLISVPVLGTEKKDRVLVKYQEYYQRFNRIETESDIAGNGFRVIEAQVFPVEIKNFGAVFFVPAIDQQYQRLAVFLVGADGGVVYKTDELAANHQQRGELKQLNRGIAAVSFQDVNDDRMTDILLISFCGSERNTYKVGDVLFQNDVPGKQIFYRDYRISDKINQYGMNKSIKFMTSYLTDGYSTEFLYTATTLEQLLEKGFAVSEEQSRWTEFEKWGRLQVVPGMYRMAEYYVFMLYLVNEQGYIVWSFQPMRDYESLYALLGVTSKDIDGDGLTDILVLAKYISEETDVESVVHSDYSIYYQRTGGFYEDVDVKRAYPHADSDNLETIIRRARKYWGWN